jgi:hypothetical protein
MDVASGFPAFRFRAGLAIALLSLGLRWACIASKLAPAIATPVIEDAALHHMPALPSPSIGMRFSCRAPENVEPSWCVVDAAASCSVGAAPRIAVQRAI